jgi:hypothetical protein
MWHDMCELALRVTGYRCVMPLAQHDVICWTHSPSSGDTIRNHEDLPETEENKKSGKTQSCITNGKSNPYQITYKCYVHLVCLYVFGLIPKNVSKSNYTPTKFAKLRAKIQSEKLATSQTS